MHNCSCKCLSFSQVVVWRADMFMLCCMWRPLRLIQPDKSHRSVIRLLPQSLLPKLRYSSSTAFTPQYIYLPPKPPSLLILIKNRMQLHREGKFITLWFSPMCSLDILLFIRVSMPSVCSSSGQYSYVWTGAVGLIRVHWFCWFQLLIDLKR